LCRFESQSNDVFIGAKCSSVVCKAKDHLAQLLACEILIIISINRDILFDVFFLYVLGNLENKTLFILAFFVLETSTALQTPW